jgi:peptide deformylase
MNLPIITYPNPILNKKSQKVKVFNDELKKLADDMVKLMFANKGVGLSAPQIGKNIKLVVIEYNEDRFRDINGFNESDGYGDIIIPLTILVNPKITNFSKETDVQEEGCLSLPNIELPIRRSKKIKVLAQDINGNKICIRATDLFARALQHEIDHLDGILINDASHKKNLK